MMREFFAACSIVRIFVAARLLLEVLYLTVVFSSSLWQANLIALGWD